MALSGSRLQTALAADFAAQLASLFVLPGALLPAEQAAYTASQQHLANAMANAIGPDVVTEITGNAQASTSGVQAGGSTLVGTVS